MNGTTRDLATGIETVAGLGLSRPAKVVDVEAARVLLDVAGALP